MDRLQSSCRKGTEGSPPLLVLSPKAFNDRTRHDLLRALALGFIEIDPG